MANDTLPVVAGKVNALFDKASKADEYRIAAGVLLLEARQRVEAGEAGDVTWTEWCRKEIKRSEGDIRKVLRIAGAKDPQAALTESRQRNADVNRAYRDRAHVSAPTPGRQVAPVDAEFEEVVAWYLDQPRRTQDRFLRRINAARI